MHMEELGMHAVLQLGYSKLRVSVLSDVKVEMWTKFISFRKW